MGGIENWGVSFILRLQSYSAPAIVLFFQCVTFLGDEKFYLLLLPSIYWCIDKRLGIRLAVLVMASNTVNLMGKYAFGLPRPPAPVTRLAQETGFGFPSGHTQSVTVTFGYLAHRARRWGAYAGAGLLVFLVGLSRLYLGVHFPHDVLGGLIIGLAVLPLYVWLLPAGERRWASWPRGLRYALAAGLPVLALIAWPAEDTASSLGALAGFAVGGLIETEYIRFMAGGTPVQRLLRFLLGLICVAALYFGLKAALPEGIPWRFIHYTSVGLSATVAAPWLFVRLGLARTETRTAVEAA